MTTKTRSIRRPSQAEPSRRAREIVAQLGIAHPAQLDLELIAAYYNVYVKYRPLHNHEGHLLRDRNAGLIVVDEATRRSEKWRFVIAHELGHFFLHEALDQFEICTAADMRYGTWSLSRREAEANEFAAELLMPRALFEPEVRAIEAADLRAIGELARRWRTSLTSTALQFLAYSPLPCALVSVNARGVVEWSSTTAHFALRLRPGSSLSPKSHTFDLLQGQPLPQEPLPVEALAWSRTLRGASLHVYEQAFLLAHWRSALVLLSHEPAGHARAASG